MLPADINVTRAAEKNKKQPSNMMTIYHLCVKLEDLQRFQGSCNIFFSSPIFE